MRITALLRIPFLFLSAAAAAQVNTADDRRELGFESGTLGAPPHEWSVPTAGWAAELVESKAAEGARSARLTKVADSDAPFGNLMRSIPAAPYRGRPIRFRARLWVEGDAGGRAQMWLRADCAGKRVGAFANMHDRPILVAQAPQWTDASIELDIDDDAEFLALGVMSFGGATVFIDAMTIEASIPIPVQAPSPPMELAPRGLENVSAATRLLGYLRFFHPSDAVVRERAWGHVALSMLAAAEPAEGAADLAARLSASVAALAPTLTIWAGSPAEAPPLPAIPEGATARLHWAHVGAGTIDSVIRGNVYGSEVERTPLRQDEPASAHAACYVVKSLGGGVSCRVPVQVYASGTHSLPRTDAVDAAATTTPPFRLSALNRTTRLASVALCWGIMQHFYPYFDVVDTDWEAALSAAMRQAATDTDERAFLFTLRALIAKLRDGHGHVSKSELRVTTLPPLLLAWAGSDLVVAAKASSGAEDVQVGDVVVTLDDRSIADRCAEARALISAATEGWMRMRLLTALPGQFVGHAEVRARLRRPSGEEYATVLRCQSPRAMAELWTPEKKPADGAELAPGILYFNLDGSEQEALAKCLPALAVARGIVFDLRGYPGSAAYELVQHLFDDRATSAQWNVPLITRPDREGWTWRQSSWDLAPKAPRLRAEIAFLTDGRAISYAESIMGIVEHYAMGEIVGATTAGTNGNINPFELPGGYQVTWTGMKVLKHDGTRHHGVGIAPTVPVQPTVKGIREGRDEVLERAVAVLQGKLAEAGATKK